MYDVYKKEKNNMSPMIYRAILRLTAPEEFNDQNNDKEN
ncbi:hypothetical protein BTIS_0005 [Bifidobacterium tissieri]|uniref:Uncharacterized protein n=1 Tax=Bifidobacterium tissieri TaxID=1630162 RepID=A0A261FJD7_9BIFI|nr:hypothetical protein BTIS_0005 [Bifidobacterium tissieri]